MDQRKRVIVSVKCADAARARGVASEIIASLQMADLDVDHEGLELQTLDHVVLFEERDVVIRVEVTKDGT